MRQVLLLLLISLFLPVMTIGQVPQKFNYQAAVRNSDGSIMANQEIDLKVILRKTTTEGDIVYEEAHEQTTSAQGLIAIEVGTGQNSEGDFALIPWEENIFIQIDIKKGDDASFVPLGVSQILSVPYALHAGNAIQGNALEGQTVVHNGDAWVASNRMSVSQNTVEILPEQGRNIEEPLFSVLNSEGLIVFAVYESGATVYVSNEVGTKGRRGGFAVGGFSDQTKEGEVDYLSILPDMVQFNIQQPVENGKGRRGGFAVGGFSDQTKGYTDYLTVNSDSTTILTNLATTGNVQVQGDILTGGDIGSLPIVDIDGNPYHTVMIGSQVWMKQNLRTTKYSDGSPIELDSVTHDPAITDELEIYGKLYTLGAITDPRGLCPTGWHVPIQIEWEQLFTTLGGSDVAAASLLDNSGIWSGGDVMPTNSSGFTAVPGGYGDYFTGTWDYPEFMISSYYWIADGLGSAYQIDNMGPIVPSQALQYRGYSVRCVKN